MRRMLIIILFFGSLHFYGQEKSTLLTQLSPFLSKTYYNFNFGAISYPYSNSNLKPGFISESISKNRFSGRLLLGYKFREDFAIQYGVMRPASWLEFDNINAIGYSRSVWFNLWSLSLKKSFKLNKKLSFYSELGIGNLARVGFSINDEVIYKDAHYGTIVTGAGLSYRLNKNWDALINATYIPASKKHNQPSVFQSSVGLLYNLKNRPSEETEKYALEAAYFFPKRTLQISYGSNDFGFFANEFFSMSAKIGGTEGIGIPVFWLGEVKAKRSLMITYQQTAFHTEKLFSLDWGVSITGFETSDDTNVYAISIFPMLRFYLYRAHTFDAYVNYSIIGPTLLSKKNIDGYKTGPNITYQDFMGIGAYFGKKRNYNVELGIMHYSNGNIFPENDGVDIPLMLTIGKTL